ncbi:MAG TPA: bifunctional folylpolyglutamate synthase/dihydrofolate synthase [Lachnospiraceae bacterium]|nr:bifunctional folylpolyglutamate synthase/dihydrofolate synthase [Lachnospiraceae bacterium]
MEGALRELLREAEQKGIVLGLSRMRELMRELSDPQDELLFIHVAGTNGKGSVCEYLSEILKSAGYRTGQYSSPAVDGRLNQYRVNGEPIPSREHERLLSRVLKAAESLLKSGREEPTLFELETALAFLYFKEQNCDIVVLETGMGGRDDATNIINTKALCVLTGISEDHLGMIGDDITEITRTKCGIIKKGVPVVCAENGREINAVIAEECAKKGAPYIQVGRCSAYDVFYGLYGQEFSYKGRKGLRLCMGGDHQIENAAIAIEACDCLSEKGFHISEDNIREGLKASVCPFRMERISEAPEFILDGAHNPAAALSLAASLKRNAKGRALIFIMGMFKDKDYKEVCRIVAPLPRAVITVEKKDNPRALSRNLLKEALIEEGAGNVYAAGSIREAAEDALALAGSFNDSGKRPLIVAFGSFSYLSELKEEVMLIKNNDLSKPGLSPGRTVS